MASILNAKEKDFFALFATVCSTYVPINKGTSQRCMSSPLGLEDLPSVNLGNLLGSRNAGCKNTIHVRVLQHMIIIAVTVVTKIIMIFV